MNLTVDGSTAALGRATAITFVANLPPVLTGALSVQIARQFHVEAAAVAALVGVFFGAACVSSILLGRLVQRLGPRATLQAVVVLSATSLVAAGLSGSMQLLGFALAIGGVSTAIVTPAANLLVSAEISIERHGVAFGILRAAQPGASLVAGIAVPTVALTLGWNAAFFIGAGLAMLAGTTLHGWHRTRGAQQVPKMHESRDRQARPDIEWSLLFLAVSIASGAGVISVLGTFFVPAAVSAGHGEALAGLLLASGSILGLGGRLIVGWLADRGQWQLLKGVAVLLAGGAVGCLLLAGAGSVALAAGTFLAFAFGWSWPGLFHAAIVSLYRHAPAAATGYTQAGAFFGSVVLPIGFGLTATTMSYQVAWVMTAAVAAAAAALVLWTSTRKAPR